jgi:hypothetical protein
MIVDLLGDYIEIRMHQGDSFGPIEFELTNPDDSPVDLTGCTVTGKVGRVNDSGQAVSEDVNFEWTDQDQGKFKATLTQEQTDRLQAGKTVYSRSSRYEFWIRIEDSLGRLVKPYHGCFLMQGTKVV